jgi:hypothetical protein
MAPLEASHPVLSQQLLLHVAEELKLPLQQIARQAEFGLLTGEGDLGAIQNTADMAMRLIDNYAFGLRLALEPEQLVVEPVSVSSVLYDSCQELNGLAKRYGVHLDLDIGGRYGPVMANRIGLQSALVSLGAAIIEALPALESSQLTLHLATHRSRYGIVAGVYTDSNRLSATALESGRNLHGKSRQPLINLTHTSGAGIFVADHIMRAMHLKLRSSRHNRLYGLGTVLQPNPQMQLV